MQKFLIKLIFYSSVEYTFPAIHDFLKDVLVKGFWRDLAQSLAINSKYLPVLLETRFNEFFLDVIPGFNNFFVILLTLLKLLCERLFFNHSIVLKYGNRFGNLW